MATEQIVQITTNSDEISEDIETFLAVLSSPSAGATLGVERAAINITDTSSVILEFFPVMYTVLESNVSLTATIVKRTNTTRTVSVLFSTRSGSATGMGINRKRKVGRRGGGGREGRDGVMTYFSSFVQLYPTSLLSLTWL